MCKPIARRQNCGPCSCYKAETSVLAELHIVCWAHAKIKKYRPKNCTKLFIPEFVGTSASSLMNRLRAIVVPCALLAMEDMPNTVPDPTQQTPSMSTKIHFLQPQTLHASGTKLFGGHPSRTKPITNRWLFGYGRMLFSFAGATNRLLFTLLGIEGCYELTQTCQNRSVRV